MERSTTPTRLHSMRTMILPLFLAMTSPLAAQINAGSQPAAESLPFTMTTVATITNPWKLAFLPEGRMLVTDKPGKLWLVQPDGTKSEIGNVPPVAFQGQGGMLGIFLAPSYVRDDGVYLTYSEPGPGGSGLALAHAKLKLDGSRQQGMLEDFKVIWRQLPRGKGGQFGAYVAFAPDGKSLFLSSGERQRFTPAQDPNDALGKILHLTLDGKPAPGNPMAGKTGAASVPVFDPPTDSEAAMHVPRVQGATSAPNLTPAETWSSGHRNPYGLAFDRAGRLWETEMGPRGGDELNLIVKGRNYGWPLVSYGTNYDGVPITNPDTRSEFQKPAIYWNPVISPSGLVFYSGKLWPQWDGSALIGGLSGQCLVRIAFDGEKARPAERFNMGFRVRDVAVGPDDGAIWVLADGERGGQGRLIKLTPR